MPGHATNPIFFNKKNKDWTSRTPANPHPSTPNNISFFPYPHLKVDVICVSPLTSLNKSHCIIISMQKITKLHKLNGRTHFWSQPLKNHWRNLKLSWMFISMQKKKKSLICCIIFWDSAKFRNLWPEWLHPFLTMPNQRFFKWLLVFINLYQHANNQATSSIFSADIIDLKSCNLIGWEFLAQISVICAGIQQII